MGRKFEYPNGRIEYKNEYGEFHREDGPAIIDSNGDQHWYRNGKKHREDGPAVIRSNGNQIWGKNDKIHREDGPAVIFSDGNLCWCLYGNHYSFKEWIKLVNISDELRIEMALKYG